MAPWACPSCGARAVERRDHAFRCRFCGSTVRPRLEQGTLCGESGGEGSACNRVAVSLCDACGLPLCDRHNDPKTHYWGGPLEAKSLCPGWDVRELREWARELSFRVELPVPGFEPFPLRLRRDEAVREAGLLEEGVREAVGRLVRGARGELNESGCLFPDHCAACVGSVEAAVDALVEAQREPVYKAAIEGLLSTLLADTEEALRYVEAYPGATLVPAGASTRPWQPGRRLRAEGPAEDWVALRERLRERRDTLLRLRERAGGETA